MPSTDKAAPLFRRVVAFWIDFLILSVPAGIVGNALFEPISHIGHYGRIAGALLVILYFGYFDSALGGGRSPGKRLLGVKVSSVVGGMLSPARAALRALIATSPILLNGITIGTSNIVADAISNLVIYGLALALPYLLIFNTPSRQSLHDIATNAMVVRAESSFAAAMPVQPFHWGALALLAGIATFGPMYLYAKVQKWTDQNEVSAIVRRVEALPDIHSADINRQWTKKGIDVIWHEKVEIVADLWHWPKDSTALANEIARAIYNGNEKLIAGTPVIVRLRQSYTLGIVDGKKSEALPIDRQLQAVQRRS